MNARAKVGLVTCIVLVLAISLRVAWVCDDAYITVRTIDHWQLGYGPVWNTAERVQTYTHPLWMGLLALVSLATGELYFTAIATGIVCSAAGLVMLARLPGAMVTWPVLLLLGFSKAWTEFATSGLENALSYALVGGAIAMMSAPTLTRRQSLLAALFLGLVPLCRPDLALVVAVPALVLVWSTRGSPAVLATGLIPGVLWTAFATIYYGSPLPNTALAKLGHAPLLQNLGQGALYFWNSLSLDPVLLPTAALGLGLGLGQSRTKPAMGAFAVGAVLYLLYVWSIGGDFMSGRFFTVPFFIAVAGLMSSGSRWVLGAVPVGLLLTLSNAAGPLRTGGDFHVPNWDDAGIADERGWYYPHLGLVPILREQRDPPKPGRTRRAGEGTVRMGKAIGMDAYMAGPQIHLVDAYALCDPLLARIPSDETLGRPGHWIRPVPRGYLESLKSGRNELVDPEVAALWEDVKLATRAPLWTPGRAAAIARLAVFGRTRPIAGVPPMTTPPQPAKRSP